MPYEFLPLPEESEIGLVYNRAGHLLGEARVVKVRSSKVMDGIAVVSVAVPKEQAMTARSLKPASTIKRRA